MYCIECGTPLPLIRTNNTICSNPKCKTKLGTWWDENSKTMRTNRLPGFPMDERSSSAGSFPYRSHYPNSAYSPSGNSTSHSPVVNRSFTYSNSGSPDLSSAGFMLEEKNMMVQWKNSQRKNGQSIEERSFLGALICLEGHFEATPGFGGRTMTQVRKMIAGTLERSLGLGDVREALAKNVDIWMRLRKIVLLAVPTLVSRSLRETQTEDGIPSGLDVPESAALILKNYDTLIEDLSYLNNLLVISRNMLAIKETAQEICATVAFDKAVHKLIILCVNVTSKGYDGENVDEFRRGKLNEITELLTCLQHTHNWTMGNDRFKMSFWFDMLFDNDLRNDAIHELPPDGLNVENVYREIKNWFRRHSEKDKEATKLLEKYSADVLLGQTPGPLPLPVSSLDEGISTLAPLERYGESPSPVWKPDMEDKYEQDRLYARVSHEIDIWWKRVRDANYEGWVVPMESVEGAIARAESCRETAMDRFLPRGHAPGPYEQEEHFDEPNDGGNRGQDRIDTRSIEGETGEGDGDEEEEDDDDSYVEEGPLRGLLTEIPNILDTKQIEALHMTVKACIVDSMGSGLTPAGENLQKTRCKMFLALDCGKNLLREMLVFIAVWEQTDQQFIFQITAQIIESFHHNALLPYAWNSLRIVKDIVSPAQTVLLRLINYMFRARKDSPIYDDLRDYNRDAKLIHFLYNYFRCRVVPDCIALIYAQAQIRCNKSHPSDFPVDLWDMERAKDGLSQYLDFISVIAEIPEMRPLLIEWEAVYELVTLLKALEAGVARKSLDERPMPGPSRRPPPNSSSTTPNIERPYDSQRTNSAHGSPAIPQESRPTPTVPPLHDTPHKFPWSGIKTQILIILTSLVAPSNTRRNGPGNPTVQRQLLYRGGLMPLLNCCVYDGHNEYLKERATLAIKFVMEGCDEAQKFVRELVPMKQPQAQAQATQHGAQESFQAATGHHQAATAASLPLDQEAQKASISAAEAEKALGVSLSVEGNAAENIMPQLMDVGEEPTQKVNDTRIDRVDS
ncbi:Adenosinetriphosphatase [Chlorociboria aeruginascens]|nr:Adenosinetriphosphatase [Chlorociboria aeruginascens]